MAGTVVFGALGTFSISTGPTGPTGGRNPPTVSSVFSMNSVILASPTSSIGCNISQDFHSFRCIAMLRSLNQKNFDQICVQFNDDTGNNYAYSTHYTIFSGSISTLAQINSGSYIVSGASGAELGFIIANNGMTGLRTYIDFEIPFYTGTNNYKNYNCYSSSFFPYGGTTGNEGRHLRAGMIQGMWVSMSPITKISLYQMSGGLFDIGSSLLVHGEN